MFDQLPLGEQNYLLTYRWDKVAGPSMLPILRRYAQAYQIIQKCGETNAYSSLQTQRQRSTTLERTRPRYQRARQSFKRSPALAPALIRGSSAYCRTRPLPEVNFELAKNLTAGDDFEGLSNIASLIARYGTDAILPQVTAKLDPTLGKWACAIQDPLLAFILRVNPPMARPRIEEAVSARGKEFSACNRQLFQSIAEIYYDPVLEEIGIRSLDDPDPQVAMTAATMLGKYGSPAAETALWHHYTVWSASWSGRESELDLTFAESDERIHQLGLGQNLAQALATANPGCRMRMPCSAFRN